MKLFSNISTLVIIFLAAVSVSALASDLPLIHANNLEYLGAFKTPIGDDYSYGGSVITFNPTNNSLFIVGHINQQKVAEISIPTPVNSTDLSSLNRATVLQSLVDITEGNRELIRSDGTALNDGNGTRIGGLMVDGERLIGSLYAFYNTAGTRSHFTSGTTLATTGDWGGNYTQTGSPTSSYINGWMTKIPSALQSELGGQALAGNGSLSILSRTSYGPAASVFNPADIGTSNPFPTNPLLYYDQTHPINGGTNALWNDTTKMAGITLVDGSRSVLFFGYHGFGPRNYGGFSSNPIFADECSAPDICVTGPKGWAVCADKNNCTTGRKGIPYDTHPDCSSYLNPGSDGCYYDPTGMGDKGPHAYPYRYQVWAYDANDLTAVKAGAKQPWEVLPYAVWEPPINFNPTHQFGGAAAYDASTGRLYVAQPNGEKYGCCQYLAVIHVFQINMSASSPSTRKIKGRAMLFEGTVKLKNNGGDEVELTATSRSTTQDIMFPTEVPTGETYSITVSSSPGGYDCSILNPSGAIANNDVSDIILYCNKIYGDTTSPTQISRPWAIGGRVIAPSGRPIAQ